jgi:hypothetical protein
LPSERARTTATLPVHRGTIWCVVRPRHAPGLQADSEPETRSPRIASAVASATSDPFLRQALEAQESETFTKPLDNV